MLEAPTTIVLLRHGQSVGNIIDQQLINGEMTEFSRSTLLKGDFEWPLTTLGHEQAHRAGIELRKRFPSGFDQIFCSPFARSQQTLHDLQIGEGTLDERLQEQNWGELNGPQILDHIAERQAFEKAYPYDIDLRPPGGETIREVHGRIAGFWKEKEISLRGKTALIMSHWAPLFLSRMALHGVPIEDFPVAYQLNREIFNCQLDIYSTHPPSVLDPVGWWSCSLCVEVQEPESYPWQQIRTGKNLL